MLRENNSVSLSAAYHRPLCRPRAGTQYITTIGLCRKADPKPSRVIRIPRMSDCSLRPQQVASPIVGDRCPFAGEQRWRNVPIRYAEAADQ